MFSSGKKIIKIISCSPASRAGLKLNDLLISCNDQPIRDWVDLLSFATESTIQLLIKRGPILRKFTLRRKLGNPWGLELADSRIRSCANHCIFCFVDQQPPGLRKALSVKDDDVRYSFLSGTYITLTDKQVNEAIARGFSSLHVSVQSTDPVIRGKMLGLNKPLDILPLINKIAEHKINIQAQIVEVPGWNDNYILEQSIAELYNCSNVEILGVVPVGITKWRQNLTQISTHSKIQAQNTLKIIKKWQNKALNERGVPWIFAGDEYYALSAEPIPSIEHYSSSTLQANGIGLLAEMINNCKTKTFHGKGVVLTGLLAAPYIEKILKDSHYKVFPVKNTLMGESVTVAGLLSGKDVINYIIDHTDKTEIVFLPSIMFNHDALTLDELTAEEISKKTGLHIRIVDSIGELE